MQRLLALQTRLVEHVEGSIDNGAMVESETYDVAIVGTGPAGLFAAHELARLVPEASVVALDRGEDLHTRAQPGSRSGGAGWLSGFGGSGFFIGGRMSLDLSTLTGSPSTVSRDTGAEVSTYVDSLLATWCPESAVQECGSEALMQAAEAARAAGLEFHLNYPARHLSPDQRSQTLTAMREALAAAGIEVRSGFNVESVSRLPSGWSIHGEGMTGPSIVARALLLAPGRPGAAWLAAQLDRAGLDVTPERSVGVRLETASPALAPLTDLNPDPRLSMNGCSGTFRTYAFTKGAQIVVDETALSPRIAVRPRREGSGNASFALLWRPTPRLEAETDLSIARPTAQAALCDLDLSLQLRSSGSPGFHPSLHLLDRSVRDHWPVAYWSGFEQFLRRMGHLVPDLLSAETAVYSPAVESVWTYVLDGGGRAFLPGLYLAGDGAGISQGAMAAAISGVMAGRAIAADLEAREL